MSLLQTPVSLVDGIAEESLRFKESFAVVCIPLRSMRGTWTTSTICNYDEDRMHLRRLPETSLMQPVTEPTAASRLNSRPSACGFDARNAFTTAPADFAFGAVSSCPSFYRGEQYDSDLGLYYLRARYYNPATGRFLSRDPNDPQLFDADGTPADPKSLHKYLYAGGDPVDGLDPSGRAVLIQYNFLGRVNQLAVHAAHHYWEVPLIGKLWCIHLQLLSYVAGVSGSAWRFQIPLPWCSAAGPF